MPDRTACRCIDCANATHASRAFGPGVIFCGRLRTTQQGLAVRACTTYIEATNAPARARTLEGAPSSLAGAPR